MNFKLNWMRMFISILQRGRKMRIQRFFASLMVLQLHVFFFCFFFVILSWLLWVVADLADPKHVPVAITSCFNLKMHCICVVCLVLTHMRFDHGKLSSLFLVTFVLSLLIPVLHETLLTGCIWHLEWGEQMKNNGGTRASPLWELI